MRLALLGQQRFDPNLQEAASALSVSGKVALVTAGWQERELEDQELSDHLGGQTVNLELHRRADEVFNKDPVFREAYRARQLRYREIQDFYRVRLAHLIDAANVIAHRAATPEALEEEHMDSVTGIMVLDRHHLNRCERVRREFREACEPESRPIVAHHREEIRLLLEDCGAIAIAGGHVASLLNRLHLFGVEDMIGERAVLAWSGGAMVITERVIVFHDDPPHGVGSPQVLDAGLGLVRGLVALPNPESRLVLDDPERMRMYARRFAPATCAPLPRRSYLLIEDGRAIGNRDVLALHDDGAVAAFPEGWAA